MISSLEQLIHETIVASGDSDAPRSDALLAILRKNHFWPALQMKKFFDRSGLVLLHNTYKRVDVDHFRSLYDQCRSVVLDLDAPEGKNIVVTLAHSIPERMTVDQYMTKMCDQDTYEMAYEGTVVYVYEHGGKWYFGTSSCPSVDSSRFFHPTKTHGEMLNEVLCKLLGVDDADAVRDTFVSNLDVNKAYAFVLVHHQNKHVVDYTAEFGENYAELVHIASRDRSTLEEDDITAQPFADVGVKYATRFAGIDEALDHIKADNVYGMIVKANDGVMYKVSSENIVQFEECNLGNPNKWVNMLSVYLQSKPHYHINDYIRAYAPDLEYPKDENGRELAPTYIIHTVVCTMRDILYDWYVRTTVYNPNIGRFRMNKQLDASLPPILRFHLAQLRHLQVNDHAHAFINMRTVYHYLCHHQTLKNVRSLIQFFATTGEHNMTYNQAQCFVVLNQMLTE